ncbi:MAG: P1 family peptidase [Anaerolineae bacterium]|nr:P1 family peptidase [Anaerolineae bacterium]
MPRFQEYGLRVGQFPSGKNNAITDVEGVAVGHMTLIEGSEIRTGVTAVLPHGDDIYAKPLPAAVHTINGFGKATGFEQVRELGALETPIILTNTLSVGMASYALADYMAGQNRGLRSVNPLVGECNDGFLNDIRGQHIQAHHVLMALQRTTPGAVTEGNVGAGTGTSCYGFKGGIGTASRKTPQGYTVGVLMQTNFGARGDLLVLGSPIGQHIPVVPEPETPPEESPGEDGSIMIVLATDAPLTSRQLGRLARRVSFGLARTGTMCDHGSGDFVVAFSTAYPLHTEAQTITRLPDRGSEFNPLFRAVVESVEEAVYNALLAAETLRGHNGHTLHALPQDALLHWLRHYGRLP